MKKLLAVLVQITFALPGQSQVVLPNDPLFHLQKSFSNPADRLVQFHSRALGRPDIEFAALPGFDLNITKAWALTTGSRSVIVAVLDDGFFYQHEDVRDNIWLNAGESGIDARGRPKEINGVDDDGNGYVDDVVGYDFAFNDPDPDAYVFYGMDRDRIQPYWHSIPALGIIGARGNNGIGVAGINWETSLMLLKIGAQGLRRGEVDLRRKELAAKAIRYAVDNGARVVNWSGFVDDKDPVRMRPLKEAFDYAEARGVLIVLAAGNNGTDFDLPQNAVYPQNFKNENILRVAEVNFLGELESTSTFGHRTVHVGAIAKNFTTTVVHGRSAYDIVSGGTSNSAPVATGVAALLFSIRPDLRGQQVKEILMRSVRRVSSLEQKLVTGGVIDAFAAVTYAMRVEPH
jgi:thermitase